MLRAFVIFLGSSTVIGCGGSKQVEPFTMPPPTTRTTEEWALPRTAQSTLIKDGMLPLVYLAEADVTLRVADLNAKSDLAVANIARSRIVRIDAQAGIFFGDAQVRVGPLPADHRYGIFLEPDSHSFSQTTRIAPQNRGSK